MQLSVIRGREEVLWEARTAGVQPDVGWGKGRAKPSGLVGCHQVIGWTVVRRQRKRINPCKNVDVQESSQLETVGGSMGTCPLGEGQEGSKGANRRWYHRQVQASKLPAVQLFLSCKLLQPVAPPPPPTYLDVSLSISNKSMPPVEIHSIGSPS